MYDPPYAVWSIWQNCGWLERFVLVLLAGLIIYSLLAAIVTIVRIRSLETSRSSVSVDLEGTLKGSQRHWHHIRQATDATFYLFGLVLFLVLENVGIVVGDGGLGSAANHVLGNFILSCAFAANAFLGFLILHPIRWFVSTRISASLKGTGESKQRAKADG
jgi:hypothetical protein